MEDYESHVNQEDEGQSPQYHVRIFLESHFSTKMLTVLTLPLLQISATKIELVLQDSGSDATLLLVRYVLQALAS